MGRNSLFLVFAALPLFACNADGAQIEGGLRSHEGDHGKKSKKGEKSRKGEKSKKGKNTYPGKKWKQDAAERHGLSSEGLADMAAIAGEHGTSCLVVIRDGVLVGEWYWDGYDAETPLADVWSVTKSVTSVAIGVAAAEGLLDIHDRVAEYVPEWQGGPSEDVTIFDLLTHTSGREWDFASDMAIFEAQDQTAYSLSFGQALAPGERWDYSNLGVQTLEAVLEHATGGDIEAYYQAKVFERIGMDAKMARDPSANPLTYTGLSASCRDMARFGHLILREGRWKHEQVVPRDWVKRSTAPSTELNEAYGYLWWLNSPGHVVLPSIPARAEYDGQMFPSAPEDMVFALGAFGQFVAIDPEDEIVMVRLTDELNYADPLGTGEIDDILGALERAKLDGCD